MGHPRQDWVPGHRRATELRVHNGALVDLGPQLSTMEHIYGVRGAWRRQNNAASGEHAQCSERGSAHTPMRANPTRGIGIHE
jgi:hypothetical protein